MWTAANISDWALTHLCGMYFTIFTNWMVVFFISFSNFKANSGEPDQMSHFVASDLVLHFWPMSHKIMLGLYGLRVRVALGTLAKF